jgi:hypothetical protein
LCARELLPLGIDFHPADARGTLPFTCRSKRHLMPSCCFMGYPQICVKQK